MAYKDPAKQRAWYQKRHQRQKDDPGYKQRRKESDKRFRAKHPEYMRAYQRAWAAKNREKMRAKWRAWYAKNREHHIATRMAWQKKNKVHWDAYNKLPSVVRRRNESARRATRHMRELVIEKYGGKCACCNEADIKFLTIDHIDGNGNKHRKELNLGGGRSFYYWLRRNGYPKGYRVLCMNCNWARAIYGKC